MMMTVQRLFKKAVMGKRIRDRERLKWFRNIKKAAGLSYHVYVELKRAA